MAYQPFILKYRPRTFDDVVGQEHVSRTLRNALASDRLVHAYLFTGPRGTGKTTMARILARALNCVNGPTPDPCGVCEQCVSIIEGRSMDIIEIDAASNTGVDNVRELRESVKYAPADSRTKLYILDECHMLSVAASNALLKTLEEPPPHAYFALLTTEVYKILPTIISRCQRFDFRPVSGPDTVRMLRRIADNEGLRVQDEAMAAIAHAAEGGMRDAESIFEQVVAFSDSEVTLEITNQVLGVTDADTLLEIAEIIARQDLGAVFAVVDRLVSEGKNLGRLIEDLTGFFRDLLRLALAGGGGSAWLQLGPDGEQRMRQAAQTIGQERLLAAVHALAELTVKIADSSQHALLLELALTELANPAISAPKSAPRPAAPAPAATAAPALAPPAPAPPVTAPPVTAPPPAVLPPPQAPTPAPPVPVEAPAPEPVVAPAPVVVEEPAPMAPPVTPGELSCELIWSRWSDLLDGLRVNVRAFLLDAVPTELRDENLVLSFPAKCRFHAGQAKTHSEAIQGALEGLFGKRFLLQTRVCDTDNVPRPGGIAAPPAAALSPGAPVMMPAPVAPQAAPPPELSAAEMASLEAMAPEEDQSAPPLGQPPVAPLVAPVAPPPVAVAPPAAPVVPPPAPVASPPVVVAPAPAEPAAPTAPISTDQAVAQTLSLFPGSQEILPPEQNHQ